MRSGPISVRFVADASIVPPRIAFATPRKVGTAVIRNRVRRRLRAILAGTSLEPGLYLVRVSPGAGELASPALRAHIERATGRRVEAPR